jgi:hypothetical protein
MEQVQKPRGTSGDEQPRRVLASFELEWGHLESKVA